MSPTASPTVVMVPGLRDHVPDHWQTILAGRIADARTVPPLTSGRLSCGAQVTALNDVLSDISGPVVVVAHSAGVMTVAHWTRRHRRRIEGALLAAPRTSARRCPRATPLRRPCARTAGCPCRGCPCPSPASSRRAPTTPWPISIA